MGRGRYPRRLKIQPPSEEKKGKYLHLWFNKELYHNIHQYPEISSSSLFGNEKPLEVDIGCGTGEFICRLGAKHPEKNYIGIDVAFKPLYRAVETAAADCLDNIRFIRADMNLIYPLLQPVSLRKVYFHFPIPIRKASQKKHVIFTPDFLNHMHKALEPGGQLSVMSDDPLFFEELKKTARQDLRFQHVFHERNFPGITNETPATQQKNDPVYYGDNTLTVNEMNDGEITYCQFIWESRGCPTFRFEMIKTACDST